MSICYRTTTFSADNINDNGLIATQTALGFFTESRDTYRCQQKHKYMYRLRIAGYSNIQNIERTPLTWQITKVISYEQYDGTKYSYFPLEFLKNLEYRWMVGKDN